MSLAAINAVWKCSRAKGSGLLVLLAVADYAHDDGRDAWMKLSTLAAKSRMTERGVLQVLSRLKRDGEVEIEQNETGRTVTGGYRPRRFIHVLCALDPEKFSGAEPEKISGAAAENPKSFQVKPEKISGKTRTGKHQEPERRRFAYKEDPSGNCQEHKRRVCVGHRPHPLDEPAAMTPAAIALFDELWAVYPDKTSRVGALRAWHALQPTEELARFIVEHVKVRVAAGWGRALPGVFQARPPFLARFLDERRWQEHYQPPRLIPGPARAAVEGQLVMRSCQACGHVLEGRVVNGVDVYPPCPQCAPAGQASDQGHARRVM